MRTMMAMAWLVASSPALAGGPTCKDLAFDGFTADVWKGEHFGFVLERAGTHYLEVVVRTAQADPPPFKEPAVTLLFDDGQQHTSTHKKSAVALKVEGHPQLRAYRLRLPMTDELKAALATAKLVSVQAKGELLEAKMTYDGELTEGEACCGLEAETAKTLAKMASCIGKK